jgi:hypothetical protein
MGNYSNLLKRHFPFSENETKGMIISILCLTFIVAFNDKSESIDLAHWLGNFFMWLVIVSASFFVHQAGHRMIGIKVGYRVEYTIWWYGLLLGLAVMLISRGKVWVLIPGGIWIHHLAIQRIGRFRYGPNIFSFSMISLFGPLASILFGGIIKTIEVWFGVSIFGQTFVHNLFMFNMAIAAYSLLPIPPLAGSRIFFASRLTYVLVAASVITYAALLYFKIYSYIIAVAVGIIVWLLYYIYFEKKSWSL